MPSSYLFIDGSYYVIYKYYALRRWAVSRDDDGAAFAIEDHLGAFRSRFDAGFLRGNRAGFARVFVGRDAPLRDLWRVGHLPEYKQRRARGGASEDLRAVFDAVYGERLFGAGAVTLSHPALEADDCIALALRLLAEREPDAKATVITADRDYLQLAGPNVTILDMKGVDVGATGHGNPQKDLFCKVLAGDPSDNIPPVFPRKIGPKRAAALFDAPDRKARLGALIAADPGARARLDRNELLIDFARIPPGHAEAFRACLGGDFPRGGLAVSATGPASS
jgi:5'-3' exonuclease